MAHTRNVKLMKDMLQKSNPSRESVRQLMSRTFHQRRVSILDNPDPQSVKDIAEEYPVFTKAAYVSS